MAERTFKKRKGYNNCGGCQIEEAILSAINGGKDILGRGLDCEFVAMDASYPRYILENLNKYAHLIRQQKRVSVKAE